MAQISKIKYRLLCLVAFTLSAYIWINATSFAILLYAFFWFIEGGLKNKFATFFHNKYALLFSGFYALYAIGMFYTSNVPSGWFDLQVKLSLFVFPPLLVSQGHAGIKEQKQLMYAFIAGCVVNGLICLGVAIWRYYAQGLVEFEYMKFSVFLHPSYFSMYIDMALLFIYYLFTHPEAGLKKGGRIFLVFSVFFLAFILVLLQSKMGMFISLALVLLFSIKYAMKENRVRSLIVMAGIAVICLLTYRFIITGNHSRVMSAVNIIEKDNANPTSIESTHARYYAWHSACKVISRTPVAGVGTGDVEDSLVQQYLRDGYTGIARERLNAHNQYLQTAVALGGIGLLLMLSCFAFPFFKCIKEQRFVYAVFIAVVAVNLLVEAMFETQHGTIFYGLFNSLLMFNFVI